MTSSEDDTGTGRLLRGGRMVARLLLVWLLVAVALLYGVLSAVVWPLVLRFALPIPVFTLGIGSPLLLGAGILALWFVVPGVVIANLRTAVIVVIVMSVVGSTVSSLLALDEDELFLRRAARRFRPAGSATVTGTSRRVCCCCVRAPGRRRGDRAAALGRPRSARGWRRGAQRPVHRRRRPRQPHDERGAAAHACPQRLRNRHRQGYYAYFAKPVNLLRTIGSAVVDILREVSRRRASAAPRSGRG